MPHPYSEADGREWVALVRQDHATGRPRRFDTTFFAVDAKEIAARVEDVIHPESELTELVWLPLEEAQELDLPHITGVDGDLKNVQRPFTRCRE